MNPTEVTWLPEHPVSGSVSMQRYWKLLEAAIRPEDPFHCTSVLPAGNDQRVVRGGTARRFLTRQLLYPARVRFQAKGTIIHVLDHSWADLFQFMPRQACKVVTVHDLIPLRFPGELNDAQVRRFRSRVAELAQADAIVAVSHYTKREIEDLLGIDGQKIHVVFNGVELPDEQASRSREAMLVPRVPGDTSFHIGSIGSTLVRKNLEILPAALARLRAKIQRKVVLVRAGSMLPRPLSDALRKELGADGLIELGTLSDDALAGYYAGLDALVVPSLYEGFGLPVLEGMAARIPVVSSSSSSLPEVGGDNVLYFNPADSEELAKRLSDVAEGRLPEDWTELAYKRARSFSWRRTLEGIYAAYEAALALNSH